MEFLLALAWLWASSPAAGSGRDLAITVEAGTTPRHHTPVALEVELGDRQVGAATMVSGQEATPAQVEPLGRGRVRIWWIVSRLGAGEERTYRLEPHRPPRQSPVFSWRDSSGPHGASTDLVLPLGPVLRYVHTAYSPQDVEATKKVFHHVFSPPGGRPITKGPGGLYSHHRGIFFGYNQCQVGEETYDVWHGRSGEHQAHVRVLEEWAGPVMGGHAVRIHWNDRRGRPFAEEHRHVTAYTPEPGGGLLVEFTSTLTTSRPSVGLGGDRQHAGVQFRAAQWVAEHQDETRFLRPRAWAHLGPEREVNSDRHRDLPWNAMQFRIEGQAYTVVYLSDPRNPGPADSSERLYGRFGEFIPWQLAPDRPLELRYRWWIVPSHDVSREEIEERYEDLAAPPVVRVVESPDGG